MNLLKINLIPRMRKPIKTASKSTTNTRPKFRKRLLES